MNGYAKGELPIKGRTVPPRILCACDTRLHLCGIIPNPVSQTTAVFLVGPVADRHKVGVPGSIPGL